MCSTEPSLPMKYEGEGINQRKNALIHYKFVCPKMKWVKVAKCTYNVNVTVKTLVLLHLAVECFTFILKKIYVPILAFYVVQMSGMKLIKSVPL